MDWVKSFLIAFGMIGEIALTVALLTTLLWLFGIWGFLLSLLILFVILTIGIHQSFF
jgi:hypothetical protein